jgi:2-polyprenyl-3-methyl-5-hydroxy-6-metoxy-1,4-benzoquinol methylase
MIKQPNSLKREAPSEWEGLAMRERSILSVRSEYFQSVIFDTLHLNPHEQKVLHIGGRRGLFAQELARRGFHVAVRALAICSQAITCMRSTLAPV